MHRYITPLAKLVKVPVELLLREWNGREAFEESEDEDVVDMRLKEMQRILKQIGIIRLNEERTAYNTI